MSSNTKDETVSNSKLHRIKSRLGVIKFTLTRLLAKLTNYWVKVENIDAIALKHKEESRKGKDYYDEKYCKSCKRQIYKYRLFEADRI